MSVNYKGKLNEYCQKEKWGSPHYDTVKIGELHNTSLFVSTITLRDGTVVSGNQASSKKLAEQYAASEALYLLSSFSEIESFETSPLLFPMLNQIQPDAMVLPPCPFDVTEIAMIDAENLPNLVKEMKYNSHLQIIAYYSKNHHMAYIELPNHIEKKLSPCTRSDGCDIFMAMDIMNLPYEYNNLKKIVIYSRDKFAAAVADNFNTFFPEIEIRHEAFYSTS